MGLFDWIGPTSLTKRRGPETLPGPGTDVKSYPYIDDIRAVIISPLVHGPGATDILRGRNGDGNSAVFACLQLIATALAEPPLKPYRIKAGERIELDDQPVSDLLGRPNPHMTLRTLLGYLSNCEHVDGNAYWRKLRAGKELTGNVVELWPISPARIEPRTQSGSGDFISFYRYYKRPGQYDDIPPENMVHFRMGLDDRDHRLGCAPLKRLVREISSDEQATRYADRLLANLAINGLSLEFDKDTGAIDKAQADEMKARIQAAYGGDNVGAVSVLSPGAKLVSHGFSPEQMDLKVLHQVPEERIAAVLGVPAATVGLGAGLEHSIYNNVRQAEEHFTERKLGSMWADIADTLTLQLLPDFTSDRSVRLEFDTSDVRALSEDQDALAKRLQTLVAAGILDADEARAEIGREPRATNVAKAPANPPAQRSQRPYIVTLPLARKALEDLAGQVDGLREDALPDWEAELRTFLTAQLGRVNAALRAGADTADALVAEGEADLLGAALAPLQTAVLSDVQVLVLAELGVVFDLDDAATREFLRRAASNVVGITDTTRDAVRAALVAGQAQGEGIEQLARRLRDLPAFNARRARTVARTELGHASNTAALTSYRASGVVVGIRVFDGDYDAECAAMNGRTFHLDQAPATLQHPNCLIGDSLVVAPNVHATFTRWFDGEVVVLRTAADDLLTCTPNHPILTGRGWVAAGALRQGDYVVRCLDSQRVGWLLNPNDHHVPTRIEQVANALWPAGRCSATTVPCTAEDFHGDAVDGEICVVRSDRLDGRGIEATLAQHRSKLLIQGRFPELAMLSGFGSLAELLVASNHAPHGRMGSLGVPSAYPLWRAGHSDSHRVRTAAQAVASVLEPPTNAGPLNAEGGADLIGRLAGLVAAVELVSVDRRQFAGHVYNLETQQGWYIAENIITHNCRRAFAPITDASELTRSA